MEENNRNERMDQRRTSEQDDSMSSKDIMRDINADRDMNLNDLKDSDRQTTSNSESDSGLFNKDRTQGVGYTPNDASAVRSGGTSDMDDQAAGGAGHNSGFRHGMGSDLRPKKGVTGSDFDGQNPTS